MNWTAQQVIEKIAQVATAVGWQAGVGASETAGMFVSCLAERPDLIDRFMTEGAGLLVDGEIDAGKGCLTFYNTKGDITTPQELRMSCQVRDIKRSATS